MRFLSLVLAACCVVPSTYATNFQADGAAAGRAVDNAIAKTTEDVEALSDPHFDFQLSELNLRRGVLQLVKLGVEAGEALDSATGQTNGMSVHVVLTTSAILGLAAVYLIVNRPLPFTSNVSFENYLDNKLIAQNKELHLLEELARKQNLAAADELQSKLGTNADNAKLEEILKPVRETKNQIKEYRDKLRGQITKSLNGFTPATLAQKIASGVVGRSVAVGALVTAAVGVVTEEYLIVTAQYQGGYAAAKLQLENQITEINNSIAAVEAVRTAQASKN